MAASSKTERNSCAEIQQNEQLDPSTHSAIEFRHRSGSDGDESLERGLRTA